MSLSILEIMNSKPDKAVMPINGAGGDPQRNEHIRSSQGEQHINL
jgi:hypothetical protein